MKLTKKLLSILLVIAMMAVLCVSALAAEPSDGIITINNSVSGETYSIYKILDVEKNTNGAFRYKTNPKWEAFIVANAGTGEYFTISNESGTKYVTANAAKLSDADDAAALAADALAWASSHSISADDTAIAASTTTEFSGLTYGYYLVDTSLGTLCSIDTAKPTVTIREKNGLPSIDKAVYEDADTTWHGDAVPGGSNVAGVGDDVDFKVVITVDDNATDYIMHDSMDAGLAFNDDVTIVWTKSDSSTVTLTNGTEYTLDTAPSDTDTFDITFANTFLATTAKNETLTITYSAKVLQAAVTASQDNTVELNYGTSTNVKTDTTTTTTTNFVLHKYADGVDKLAGAKFQLKDGLTPLTFLKKSATEYQVYDGVTTVVAPDETTQTIETVSSGNITIKGLNDKTYTLVEIEAPVGYTLAASKDVNMGTSAPGTIVDVENTSGTLLPSTGNIGTTLFIVFGFIAIVTTGVFLVTNKRMRKEMH